MFDNSPSLRSEMGFDEERFFSIISDAVKCSLCQGILDNPVKTTCGHVFCSGCILSWLVRYRACPYGCGELTPSDIQNDLELREFICNMKVHCKYQKLGCNEKVRLMDLEYHTECCEFKDALSNEDDNREADEKSKDSGNQNENKEWLYHQAVSICQKGCGLLLHHNRLENHDCFVSLRAYIAEQENRMNTIETEMKQLASTATRKEKFLLTQVVNLHNKLQTEALRYKRKLGDYRSQLDNECRQNANRTYQTSDFENITQITFQVVLERQNNSLGFNIMGGYTPEQNNNKRSESDEDLSGGVTVSRVTKGSPASKSGLQKDDQVIKVNGQDLSQASHEEAVEAFRAAKEPIVVEVLRRVNKNKMKSRPPTMVSIGTQTEEDIYGYDRPPTPPPPIFAFNPTGLYQPGTRRPVAFSPSTEMGLTDIEMAHGLDYDDPYFDDRPYEMEYEEVILHRAADNQKLGLTLCYGSLEDETTDIFISEVESCSIAAQDGRIREGDQILQINGVDVHSRDQAIKLFSERGSDIKLLLARPQLQLDDGFMEDQNVTLDDLHMDILEKHHRDNMQIMASMLARGHIDEEGGTTDTATTENSLHKHEKDSGVGRTDESTKNDESSEQDVFDTECTNSPAATTKFRSHKVSNQTYSDESFLSNEVTDHDMIVNDISTEDCEKFRQHLEKRCNNNSVECSPRKDLTRKDSQSSIERELAILNKEMENIHLECQEMCNRHQKDENKLPNQREGLPIRSPRIVPRMGTRLEYLKYVQLYDPTNSWDKKDTMPKLGSQNSKSQSEKDASTTTSAYNTGESCRSTPLTLELNQGSDEGEKGFKNSMLCLAPTNMPSLSDTEKQTQTPCRSSQECSSDENVLSMTTENIEEGSLKKQACMGESLQDLYMKYADVMYTNQANLQHTIAIQQKLFQQQIDQKQVRSNRSRTSSGSPFPGSSGSQSTVQQVENKLVDSPNVTPPDSSGQMEWVVKRRPDGTRYITRRPVRSKMLKERAKKISEERCGMTTDDDAMSELKFGRYWSKEERKKHIEKARDHKRKREGMMRAKMETLKEAEEKKELNIVELSHRKMMKHKGKKVFDDFVTVQEMLAHGSRSLEGKTYNPLLSVTTV